MSGSPGEIGLERHDIFCPCWGLGAPPNPGSRADLYSRMVGEVGSADLGSFSCLSQPPYERWEGSKQRPD